MIVSSLWPYRTASTLKWARWRTRGGDHQLIAFMAIAKRQLRGT